MAPKVIPLSRCGKDIIPWKPKKRAHWTRSWHSENSDEGSHWDGTQPGNATRPRTVTRRAAANPALQRIPSHSPEIPASVEEEEVFEEASVEDKAFTYQHAHNALETAAHNNLETAAHKDLETAAHEALATAEHEALDTAATEAPSSITLELPSHQRVVEWLESQSSEMLQHEPSTDPTQRETLEHDQPSVEQTQLHMNLTQLAAITEGIPLQLAQQEDSDNEALSSNAEGVLAAEDEALSHHLEDVLAYATNLPSDQTSPDKASRPRHVPRHKVLVARTPSLSPHLKPSAKSSGKCPQVAQPRPAVGEAASTAQSVSLPHQASSIRPATPPQRTKFYPIFLPRNPRTPPQKVNTQPPPRHQGTSSAVDHARQLKARIYQDEGLYALAKHTLKQEKEAFGTLNGALPDAVGSKGYMILISSHPEIVQACIRGSWAKEVIHNKALRSTLAKLERRAISTRHPFVYLNELSSTAGDAPTANELFEALDTAERYLAHTDQALVRKIDSWIRPLNVRQQQTPGYQRYLYNASYRRSSKRPGRALAFFQHLRARLETIPFD
ncbi:hypothetical protein Slin14017_G022020 [Septoria linicola]|nr:hypothetical protein Slin14017_G022020 [Septoria linicola]